MSLSTTYRKVLTVLVSPNKQTVLYLLSIFISLSGFLGSLHLLDTALCNSQLSRINLHSANALVLVPFTVQEASKFPDIKFVSFDWLTASIDSQTQADEAQFSFSQPNSSHDVATDSMRSAPSKQKDTKGKGKKRLRSPTPMEEDSSDAKDLPEESPMKKHKEVQRAKSGSLLIPVDETCPLTGKISDGELFQVEVIPTNKHRNSSSLHWRGWNDLRCGIESNQRRGE